MVLAASIVDNMLAFNSRAFPPILIVALPVVFGMLRRGTRRIAALDHPDLDERDIAARNSAYRVAFPLLVLVIVAALVLLTVAAPDIARPIGSGPPGSEADDGWFVETPALVALGLWIGLWAVFLPTGTLAWREPDALELEAGGGGFSEPIRDALLALALVGGIGASLTTDSDVGLIPFIGSLALLGGLARRADGQPMMSRQRKWRVVIGVVMILAMIAIAIAEDAVSG
ncbi:MAG: hypothetical protein ACR2LV_05330 [Solirubrobacteraceae bacterium]